MAFEEFVIISCFICSSGRCECRSDHPEHRGHGRCKARFSRSEGWVARRVNRAAPETVQNCEILCPDCFDLAEAAGSANASLARA